MIDFFINTPILFHITFLTGQWNLLSTGPVGLKNFETQLLNLYGKMRIVATERINLRIEYWYW